jgi:hypothetical protein
MARTTIEDAQRMASYYATNLSEDVESWKRKHEEVKNCWKLEETLTLFNALVNAVLQIESRRRTAIARGEFQPDHEIELHIAESLWKLSRACSKMDDVIKWFEQQPYRVEGAKEFRSIWSEIKLLAGSSEGQPNPRQVLVDGSGHIFESTGDSFAMPGLEPESVREGLNDLELGRTRPLKDIVADSQQ